MSEKNEVEKLKLDIPTVERRIAHYPAELRTAVLWLADFTANQCARDLDVLREASRLAGGDYDKSTWSRILRGRWNRDSSDKETAPLVNLEALLKTIEYLKKNSENAERGGKVPFVWTSRAKTIRDMIRVLMAPDRVNKFGFIVGETGTEKTATLKEIKRTGSPLQYVVVDAPPKPREPQFVRDLCLAYGGTWNMDRRKQEEVIYGSANGQRAIVVENIQRLYIDAKGADQPVFNFLQKLQEETGCTVILTLTPVFAKKLEAQLARGFFEQFIGRAGGIRKFVRLEKHATRGDVLAIARAYGLKEAEEHADYLMEVSREPGLIRILFDALQDGKIAANAAGEELTIRHIKDARGDV